MVREFLKFVFSKEGQEIVRQGRLLPAVRPRSCSEELAKLK